MNKEKLRKYLQYIYPMPDSTSYMLADEFVHSCLPKNTFLIKENTLIKHSFFLEAGYIRSFVYDTDGIEVTTNLYSAPSFVNDFSPFFKRLPAEQNFQTITDCELWTMPLEKVEAHFHSTPEFREFGRLLILRHYDQQNERMLQIIKDTAETRYMKLLSKHPDVFQNVPLKIIASYLGITDTSLSRIRKEIVQK